MSVNELEPGGAPLQVDHWKPWFAWRPVRLYMTGDFAWLRHIYWRNVVKTAGGTVEYTDDIKAFPDLPSGDASSEEIKAAKTEGPAATG